MNTSESLLSRFELDILVLYRYVGPGAISVVSHGCYLGMKARFTWMLLRRESEPFC